MLKGSIPALATPMRDGALDLDAYAALIEWQIAEGSSAIVPVGTTGEASTLSHEEHEAAIAAAVTAAAGRAPVVAGAGSNSTAEAVSLSQHAERVGADALLIVSPYYNRPSQDGIIAHFRAVHDACGLPIVVYNVPSRTGSDVAVETLARLAELPRIIGVKDATGDIERVSLLRRRVGDRLLQLSGEDPSALGFNAHGGVGCISVTANVAPRACAELQAASLRGDLAEARTIQDRLIRLHKALFAEPSPGPTKFALSLLGRCANELRSPLFPIGPETEAEVRAAMREAGLIEG